ncbi:hypothetical protein ACLB2K_062245 [Fragaria x ananassa]
MWVATVPLLPPVPTILTTPRPNPNLFFHSLPKPTPSPYRLRLNMYKADRLGCRRSFQIDTIPLILGALISAQAHSLDELLLGRFLVGLGIGVNTVLVPIYISEICNFLVGLFFLDLVEKFGVAPVYCTFGGVSLFAAIFSTYYIVETKGLSLEEIEMSLSSDFISRGKK